LNHGDNEQPQHRPQTIVGRPDGNRHNRRHAQGRHLPAHLTDRDAQVRDWFKQSAEALGCTMTVDE
jgi:hypothetical protein